MGAGVELGVAVVDALARESALFAAVGLLIGGIDDLAADLLYLARARRPVAPPPFPQAQRFAILVPAWDEAAVIAPMLTTMLERVGRHDIRIYVGVYPNDPATLAKVAQVARDDARIRMVVGATPGPTTKGDNLNSMWRALGDDEATGDWRADAVVLHDAEDVVDPDELAVFERYLATYDYVQLPVLPLIASHSRWVSAHYADEFSEVHHRSLALRQRLGVALPLAGVGCAIRRAAIERVAAARGGAPFDPDSLTEDYELGLALAEHGARGCFARVTADDGRPVAVRAFFPATLNAAVRQKARWMNGIALLGWDRIGWRGANSLSEVWMRLRDRRAPLAMLVLAMAYFALGTGATAILLHLATGIPAPPVPNWLGPLFLANMILLAWRFVMRAGATGAAYGWREGMRAMPRMLVANLIGLFAARRALIGYVAILGGAALRWDKTAHEFPADPGQTA